MIYKKFKITNLIIAILIVFSMIVTSGLFTCTIEAEAAPATKTLTIKQAKVLAVANSSKIEKLEIQIDTKKAALTSAVKSISVKQKNMKTFRWSPLIKFKFPTQPNLAEAYEFQYKPIQIQYDIDKLNHSLTDQVFAEYEKVINLYVDIVVLEQGIAFNYKRLDAVEDRVDKNRVKLLAGQATQADIDNMEKEIDKLKQKISNDERSLVNNKKKISNIIGVDVTTGYRFEEPFAEAELSYSLLEPLKEYTLEHDDGYYETCVDETAKRVSTETNYKLMKNHYPSKYITMISSYVEAALKGEKIKSKPFYDKYKEFVGRVNEKWNGKKKILFFKFPKNWFQGDIDGDRFIEDDPYVLYTATMDYQDARLARENAEQELRDKVEETFNNYISVRKAYFDYKDQVEKAGVALDKATILNKAGELTYSEFKEAADSYEELQNSLFDSMKLYSQTLYSFDRLTCGGVSAYLGDLTGDLSAAKGGESYVVAEYAEGANYFIKPIVLDQQFELVVSIPDDFEIDITHFELWVDGTQVGVRTSVDEKIRHMAFDLDSVKRAFIRFYDGENFIDDVDIDPSVYSGELKIVKAYAPKETEGEIGSFSISRKEITGQYSIELTMNASENIAFYRVKDSKGKYLISESLRPIDKPFTYLNAIESSVDLVVFEFYDSSEALLYEGHANSIDFKMYKIAEE